MVLGRRIPFNQIAFATLVGVAGGMYIYKPMFEPPQKPQEIKPESEEPKADTTGQQHRGAPPDAPTHRD